MAEFTVPQCQGIVNRLRTVFYTGKTKSYEFRRNNILAIKKLVSERKDELCEAMYKDLGRGRYEAEVLEVGLISSECDSTLKQLKTWMKPSYRATPMAMLPATSMVVYEPYGVSLIIGPFNYPMQLMFVPLIGAIAAGNCAVLKPSELSPNCAEFFAKYVPMYLDPECFEVVNGAVETTKSLLAQKWDKIFFTGSTRVGKIVMKAAAEHLTSVSLELGGKSPTIVDPSVSSLTLAANRVVWGKFINTGQTCIAPDYVLCHSKIYDKFLEELKKTIDTFYGDVTKSDDFGRIVSVNYAERLDKLIKSEDPKNIVVGGESDTANRFIPPTVVKDVTLASKLMEEEIFGPILPVLRYDSANEIIDIVRKVGDKPLAMYIFARDQKFIDLILNNVQSGGVCMNDVIMHVGNCELPFGGVGASGLGSYHGEYTFKTFSHERAVMYRDDSMLLELSVRYPPYNLKNLSTMNFIVGLPVVAPHALKYAALVVGALAVAFGFGFGYRS